MTTIKLLSAGLIATAMFATPAIARENYVAQRHIAGKASTGHYIESHVGIPAPRVGALPAPPDGENCDVGDNARIC